MKSIKNIIQGQDLSKLNIKKSSEEHSQGSGGGQGFLSGQDLGSGKVSSVEENPLEKSPTFQCSLCEDRGIVLQGDVAYPCKCMHQKRLENMFRHARMARGLLNCRFENFKKEYYYGKDKSYLESALKALQAAQEFVESSLRNSHGLGLMLTGPVGAGKTFLAASIANALMEHEKQVLFLVVPDLLDQLRATFKSDESELDLLDNAREIPILILDDLGAHNYTDWTRNRIYSIINYRLNEQLPTVITTNLSLEEMEEHLGLRTTSRLIQACRIFRMDVERDIRLQQYQERERKH